MQHLFLRAVKIVSGTFFSGGGNFFVGGGGVFFLKNALNVHCHHLTI